MKSSASNDPVAIVGIGCRFPGASGPDGFWKLLREGTNAVGKVPADRRELFDSDVTTGDLPGTQWGGFLDEVDGFDWRAFSISPREATFMDPQQRLLLEVSWEALEDAGIPVDAIRGSSTAVFVGVMWNDYAKLQMNSLDGYSVGGGALAFAANRISYFFDLNGPSVSLDVSCASSLVALHLACQSIWTGESEMALAGGVNLMLAPDTTLAIAEAGILSPDGRCKTFDSSADGFVRGEGAGVVLLKPLSQALRDGDRVYATVRGTAVLHSGRTEWIMAPSVPVQERMLRLAYARAGVDPINVDFVELHGTGTRKGDPIEARALGTVMGEKRDARRPCIVGSVKTNIGHLDSAAGIAGVIKTALAIHHREIPASLHLNELNPEIHVEDLRLEYASSRRPWPETGRLPLAGVTGLSFGGGNAHIVLEGMPPPAPSVGERPQLSILPLSAHTPGALRELAVRYRQLLATELNAPVGRLCAAAARRRSHHACRVAVVGATRGALAAKLDAFLQAPAPKPPPRRSAGQPLRVAFVFSGVGAECPAGLARELLDEEPIFREEIEKCDLALRAHASWSILAELRADAPSAERRQPTLWALQHALAFLWRSWGLVPDALIGDGAGEIAAESVAGTLSREDAARTAAGQPRASGAFLPTLEALGPDRFDAFVEIGPHALLTEALRECLQARKANGAVVSSLRRSEGGREAMLGSLAELYARGFEVDWRAVSGDGPHLSLPLYPWQRERLWLL